MMLRNYQFQNLTRLLKPSSPLAPMALLPPTQTCIILPRPLAPLQKCHYEYPLQKILLLSQMPQIAAKLATLNEYSGNTSQPDIDDPYGCDLESYRQCAQAIEVACDGLLNRFRTYQNQLINNE